MAYSREPAGTAAAENSRVYFNDMERPIDPVWLHNVDCMVANRTQGDPSTLSLPDAPGILFAAGYELRTAWDGGRIPSDATNTRQAVDDLIHMSVLDEEMTRESLPNVPIYGLEIDRTSDPHVLVLRLRVGDVAFGGYSSGFAVLGEKNSISLQINPSRKVNEKPHTGARVRHRIKFGKIITPSGEASQEFKRIFRGILGDQIKLAPVGELRARPRRAE